MNILRISPAKEYLLVPDCIWDGFLNRTSRDVAIYISRGHISGIFPAHSLNEMGQHCEIVRLPGLTLMPGLVDCHVHFAMNGENLFEAISDWETNPSHVEEKARRAALDFLANGVLAVRDGGDKMNLGLNLRNSIVKGSATGPMVVVTGKAIYKRGSYGSFLGPGVDCVEEALNQVENFHSEGINQLKVVVSGLVSFKNFGSVGPVQFSADELNQIVDKAHNLDLKVMAHASSSPAVETAVRARVDSIEHGYFLESRQLEMMAERGIAWVPTLAPLGNLVFGNHIPYTGADLNIIRRSFESQLVKIKEAADLGVTIGIGTDAGANHVWHGSSYHQELNYFTMAGINTPAVLKLATSSSAKVIGSHKIMGSIASGKQPYLIGVKGDPLSSLEPLKQPGIVILPEKPAL